MSWLPEEVRMSTEELQNLLKADKVSGLHALALKEARHWLRTDERAWPIFLGCLMVIDKIGTQISTPWGYINIADLTAAEEDL